MWSGPDPGKHKTGAQLSVIASESHPLTSYHPNPHLKNSKDMFGSRRTHHTTTERTTHHRSRWGRPSRDRQAAGYKVSLRIAHLLTRNLSLIESLSIRRL